MSASEKSIKIAAAMQPGIVALGRRRTMLAELVEMESKKGDQKVTFDYITCDYCQRCNHCAEAFDLYNTNGDCLADK
jgi:hypothetical protein